MTSRLPPIRRGALAALAALLCAAALPARAQDTPIKFQLDWRFEGPQAMFLVPQAKGYYKAERLDVTVDAGNGSGGAVTRVASGAYDMGFADIAALMEFHANNPTAPNKPIAVMMVYNNTPAAVLALKKSGIRAPKDLEGKKLGAPVFDAGRKAFPIFAKANGIEHVTWTAMDPTLRETMLARGDIDAITGFSFTSLLNLEARGVKADDIVVLSYPSYGVKMYGNAIIVSEDLPAEEPRGGEGVPARLHEGDEGCRRRSERRDRDTEGARRPRQRGARAASAEARARRDDPTPDARAEGLRRGASTAPDR